MTLKPSVVRVRSAWVAGLSIVTALLLAGACGGDANTERKEAGPSADASSPEYLQHRQSAAALYRQGDLRGALGATTRMIDASPSQTEGYALASKIFIDMGDDEGGARFFSMAARQFPDRPEPWQFKGFHEFRKNLWSEALESYQKAAELDPDNQESHFRQGLILQTMGNFDGALTELRRAHELEPGQPIPAARLSRLLRITGDYEEAERVVSGALERSPDSADLHYALGQLRLRQGQDEEAERELRRAIELQPSRFDARHDLSRLLSRTGREQEGRMEQFRADRLREYTEGKQSLFRLMAARPKDVNVAVAMAEMDLTERNLPEAQRWLARAEQLGGPWERIAAGKAELFVQAGDLRAAEAELARVASSRDPRVELARAALDLAHGSGEKALARVQAAVNEGPNERCFLRRAADVYESAGMLPEAEALLVQATGAPLGLAAEAMPGMRSD